MDRKETIRMCLRDEEEASRTQVLDYIEASGRMDIDALAWDYRRIAQQRMQGVYTMLDMGVGSGELLGSFHPLPVHTQAIEAHPNNIDMARMRLSQRGVRIYKADCGGELPFEDGTFQLIINYQQPYDAAEIFRVLRPGGLFLTQQMRGDNCLELNQLLKLRRGGDFAHWHLTNARKAFESMGMFVIDAREDMPYARFYDAGAVAFYARLRPEELPGFSVEAYQDDLWDLQRRVEVQGFIACRAPRFFLVAKKEDALPD